jgi:anti-sigma regulatory factor (Ser/Thr protein kinase)
MDPDPVRARFPGNLRAPANARTFVTKRLDAIVGTDGTDLGDDIVLIVSELVTNSVRAGAATIDLQVNADAERVDVRVTDDAAGWPIARAASVHDQGGRGLSIIEHLADSWSTTAHSPGKTVTATWFRSRK